jgi:hypothetical protein
LLAVLFVAEVVTPHANDATIQGQGAMAKGLKQGGHQFAPSQVASAAKQYEVKAHDL